MRDFICYYSAILTPISCSILRVIFPAHNMMVITTFHLILSTGRGSISLIIGALSHGVCFASTVVSNTHPFFILYFFYFLPPFLEKEFKRESGSYHWKYVGWVSESDTNSKYPWWLIKCYISKGLNFCFLQSLLLASTFTLFDRREYYRVWDIHFSPKVCSRHSQFPWFVRTTNPPPYFFMSS